MSTRTAGHGREGDAVTLSEQTTSLWLQMIVTEMTMESAGRLRKVQKKDPWKELSRLKSAVSCFQLQKERRRPVSCLSLVLLMQAIRACRSIFHRCLLRRYNTYEYRGPAILLRQPSHRHRKKKRRLETVDHQNCYEFPYVCDGHQVHSSLHLLRLTKDV